jgi:two-component system, NarL family, nitrate/nitrite response regulator NarL
MSSRYRQGGLRMAKMAPASEQWRGMAWSAAGPESGPGSGASAAPKPERQIRVLIISDLLLMRAGLQHVLDTPTIQLVGGAVSCVDAIPLVANDPPDVVLVDLDVRADALKCVDELLAAAPRSRVIVLSDKARSADHHIMVELGATGLVMKSEPPAVLIKAITKVHAGEVWLDRTNTAEVLSRIARRRHLEDLEAVKIATLTRREREIITLVGEGMKNAPIAQALFLSEATVRNHLTSILDKLGLSDRFELAVYAFRHGLVEYPEAHDRRRFMSGSHPEPAQSSHDRTKRP